MKRVRLFGLVLVSVFALGAAVAGVASAEVSFLPLGSSSLTYSFTISGGASKYQTLSGKTIACTSSSGTGEVSSERLGTFKVEFAGCEEPTLKVKCADLSQTSDNGRIKMEGEFHLRMGLSGQPLGLIAFLINPDVHLLCSILLFVLLGCMVGEIDSELEKLISEVLILIKQAAGENTILSIDNDAETAMESCDLLGKQGTGTEETSALELHWTLTNFKDVQTGASVTVLIHA